MSSAPAQKLLGKRALVTAGAQGIGLAISRHLLAAGCDVFVHYRSSAEGARALAAEAAALGQVTFVDTHTHMLGPNGQPRAEWFTIDGIHMNEKGYRLWRDVLLPQLEPPVAPQSPMLLVARPFEP